MYTDSISKLIEEFSVLPGVGKRTGERYANYILSADRKKAMRLAVAIRDVKQRVRQCKICYNITEGDLCHVCEDEKRDKGCLCVVELPRDLFSIENSNTYKGLYHVLLGHISPSLEELETGNLKLDELFSRIEKSGFREIILATNPTREGDATSFYIREKLSGFRGKITRLARGVPIGSEIEFAGKAMLKEAMNKRQEFNL